MDGWKTFLQVTKLTLDAAIWSACAGELKIPMSRSVGVELAESANEFGAIAFLALIQSIQNTNDFSCIRVGDSID